MKTNVVVHAFFLRNSNVRLRETNRKTNTKAVKISALSDECFSDFTFSCTQETLFYVTRSQSRKHLYSYRMIESLKGFFFCFAFTGKNACVYMFAQNKCNPAEMI